MPDSAGKLHSASTTLRQGESSPPAVSRRVYPIGLAFIAITLIAACLAVWQLRDDRIADVRQDTRNLALVLAAQSARSFQAVDLVVRETRAMVAVETSVWAARSLTEGKGHGCALWDFKKLFMKFDARWCSDC